MALLTPVLARRRLGAELKELRDAAHVTVLQAAEKLECSTAKISRLETGKGVPYRRDVRDLLSLYGISDELIIDQLLEWAEIGQTREWWHKHGSLLREDPTLERVIALEASASQNFSFNNSLVPGLLQTGEYAEHLFRVLSPDVDERTLSEKVAIRTGRQQVLRRKPTALQVDVILDEGVLYRPIGGLGIMKAQLSELRKIAQGPGHPATLRILPYRAGGHRALVGSFDTYVFEDDSDDPVVMIEHIHGTVVLEGSEHIDAYSSIAAAVSKMALDQEGTLALLDHAISRLC